MRFPESGTSKLAPVPGNRISRWALLADTTCLAVRERLARSSNRVRMPIWALTSPHRKRQVNTSATGAWKPGRVAHYLGLPCMWLSTFHNTNLRNVLNFFLKVSLHCLYENSTGFLHHLIIIDNKDLPGLPEKPVKRGRARHAPFFDLFPQLA